MPGSRMTRADLEAENNILRERLAEARDLIDDALGLEEAERDDEDDDEDE